MMSICNYKVQLEKPRPLTPSAHNYLNLISTGGLGSTLPGFLNDRASTNY